ncbi:PHP domain-containing protein [Candidatus Moduliflexota bacterium]
MTETNTSSGRADLHLHSHFSDGTCSPTELVHMAAAAGLTAISLTDHDTVAGTDEAAAAGREAGVTVIPGVELSVSYGSQEIHILGYGIDTRSRILRETLERLAAERVERMEKMILRLQRAGVPAVFEEVRILAGGNILSRLHLANYLLEKGFVASREESFERYIGNGGPAYVRRRHLNLKGAISLIVSSGGLPVLAHPVQTRRDDIIEYLVRLGIRGIEAYYPRHTAGETARYEKICRRYGLVATGGSDFHGEGKPEVVMGAATTPPRELSSLLNHLGL